MCNRSYEDSLVQWMVVVNEYRVSCCCCVGGGPPGEIHLKGIVKLSSLLIGQEKYDFFYYFS